MLPLYNVSMLPKPDHPVGVKASAERINRATLANWLAQPHAVGQNSDAGFSDDGETGALLNQTPQQLSLKPAAVLILIVNRPDAPTILFTQRTAHLTDHGGQISFPGGRVEEDDASAEYTASQIAGARFIGFERGGHTWVSHDDAVMAAIMTLLTPAAA